MTEQEKLFFEWFEKVEEYATRHGYTINQVVNVRQSWDEGYTAAEKRIIKLLDELDDEEWMGINQNFIALINGENK